MSYAVKEIFFTLQGEGAKEGTIAAIADTSRVAAATNAERGPSRPVAEEASSIEGTAVNAGPWADY